MPLQACHRAIFVFFGKRDGHFLGKAIIFASRIKNGPVVQRPPG
jgi:hypothetical protein